jgi:hypothetical protein
MYVFLLSQPFYLLSQPFYLLSCTTALVLLLVSAMPSSSSSAATPELGKGFGSGLTGFKSSIVGGGGEGWGCRYTWRWMRVIEGRCDMTTEPPPPTVALGQPVC